MEPCQLDGWSITLIAGQYLSIGYTERQAEAGTVTSIGSRADSYGNALAESTIVVVQDRADPPLRPLHAWTTWSWPPWSGSTGTSADGCTAPADDLPPAEYDARYALRATTPTLTRATSAPLDVAIYRMAATVPLYPQPEIVQGQHCTRRCHRATGRPRRVTTLPCRYIHGRLLQEATRRLRLNLGICSGCVLAPSRSAEGETRLGLSAPPGGLQ
jgi:hypothetical protein